MSYGSTVSNDFRTCKGPLKAIVGFLRFRGLGAKGEQQYYGDEQGFHRKTYTRYVPFSNWLTIMMMDLQKASKMRDLKYLGGFFQKDSYKHLIFFKF